MSIIEIYRRIKTCEKKLTLEANSLNKKILKLGMLLADPEFNKTKAFKQKELLLEQYLIMRKYYDVLNKRLHVE